MPTPTLHDPELCQALLRRLEDTLDRPMRFMEVCGTHTVSIFRGGLRTLLPEQVTHLTGPGCPVCVTHDREVAAFLKLAEQPNVIIATFGDLLRVLASLAPAEREPGEVAPLSVPQHGSGEDLPPLCCFDLGCCDEDGRPLPLVLDPAARGMGAHAGDVLAVWGPDAHCLPLAELLGSLAPLGMTFALPEAALEACLSLEQLGGHLYGLPALTALTALPETVHRACGRLDGILLCAPADRALAADEMEALCRSAKACGVRYVYALRWLHAGDAAHAAPWQEAGEAAARELGLPWRVVCVDDGGRPPIPANWATCWPVP